MLPAERADHVHGLAERQRGALHDARSKGVLATDELQPLRWLARETPAAPEHLAVRLAVLQIHSRPVRQDQRHARGVRVRHSRIINPARSEVSAGRKDLRRATIPPPPFNSR